MTQLRKHRDAISNHFNRLLEGIGARDSSFMDVDAVSHDKATHRFLFQEFKEPHEPLDPAQRMVLRDLAGLPRCEVWFVRRMGDRHVGWMRVGDNRPEQMITNVEYQERFRRWWRNEPIETSMDRVAG